MGPYPPFYSNHFVAFLPNFSSSPWSPKNDSAVVIFSYFTSWVMQVISVCLAACIGVAFAMCCCWEWLWHSLPLLYAHLLYRYVSCGCVWTWALPLSASVTGWRWAGSPGSILRSCSGRGAATFVDGERVAAAIPWPESCLAWLSWLLLGENADFSSKCEESTAQHDGF